MIFTNFSCKKDSKFPCSHYWPIRVVLNYLSHSYSSILTCYPSLTSDPVSYYAYHSKTGTNHMKITLITLCNKDWFSLTVTVRYFDIVARSFYSINLSIKLWIVWIISANRVLSFQRRYNSSVSYWLVCLFVCLFLSHDFKHWSVKGRIGCNARTACHTFVVYFVWIPNSTHQPCVRCVRCGPVDIYLNDYKTNNIRWKYVCQMVNNKSLAHKSLLITLLYIKEGS